MDDQNFDLEKQVFPRTMDLSPTFFPYHDSYFKSLTINRNPGEIPSVTFEWFVFKEIEPDAGPWLVTIRLRNVASMKFDTLRYCDFSDGALSRDGDRLRLSLLESATGEWWQFVFQEAIEEAVKFAGEVDETYPIVQVKSVWNR